MLPNFSENSLDVSMEKKLPIIIPAKIKINELVHHPIICQKSSTFWVQFIEVYPIAFIYNPKDTIANTLEIPIPENSATQNVRYEKTNIKLISTNASS